MTGVAEDGLVLDFAVYAATAGWTPAALRSFCAARGISQERQIALWPAGVRSLGRYLTDYADTGMLRRWETAAGSLRDVLQARFEDNQAFKPAVRCLAASDVFHPIDTLQRTRKTAGLMWTCCASRHAPAGFWGEIRSWWLVCLYSLCVLVWLADRPDGKATRRAVAVIAALLGD